MQGVSIVRENAEQLGIFIAKRARFLSDARVAG